METRRTHGRVPLLGEQRSAYQTPELVVTPANYYSDHPPADMVFQCQMVDESVRLPTLVCNCPVYDGYRSLSSWTQRLVEAEARSS